MYEEDHSIEIMNSFEKSPVIPKNINDDIYDLYYNNIENNIILNYHACGLDIIQSMTHRGSPPA